MIEYQKLLKSVLSPAERKIFSKLNSPKKIQDFLDAIKINFEETGDTVLSPRKSLREGRMHCIEGAFVAATSLAYHGHEPLILDLRCVMEDEDHVVTLFKENGLWGAISKTNHAILRWRDPVYKTVRELVMSYFHEFYMHDGKKTLREYSRPFNLRRYASVDWIVSEDSLLWIADDLDSSFHFSVVPKKSIHALRNASAIECDALNTVEYKKTA